jgi:hypothetical protein
VWKAIVAGVVLAWAQGPAAAADLTSTEMRWLRGGWPVVAFAKAAGMPLDVVVQPQPTPGLPPLALAFVDGRCKLVLSMRGNPEAETTLERIAPELLDPALELMAAHELGHCRRYLDGAWHGVPAGFADPVPVGLSGAAREAYDNETASRREEGYGDLVGLAWTAARHPELYARLHAWLVAERSVDLVPGSPHDTLAWVRLAADASAWSANASLFAVPARLWRAGLAADD